MTPVELGLTNNLDTVKETTRTSEINVFDESNEKKELTENRQS